MAYCASDVTRSLSRAAGFADSLSMAAIIDVRKITNFKRSSREIWKRALDGRAKLRASVSSSSKLPCLRALLVEMVLAFSTLAIEFMRLMAVSLSWACTTGSKSVDA